MGFTTSQLVATRGADVTVLGSGAVTATGQSAAVDLGGAAVLRAQVVVSAATGTTPSLTVTIQTSHDAGVLDAWRTWGAAYGAMTAAGSSAYQSWGVDRYVRVSYVVSGTTPNITFAVVGEGV